VPSERETEGVDADENVKNPFKKGEEKPNTWNGRGSAQKRVYRGKGHLKVKVEKTKLNKEKPAQERPGLPGEGRRCPVEERHLSQGGKIKEHARGKKLMKGKTLGM